MSAKIKTTGELRTFLAEMMGDVKDGTVKVETAAALTKMAGQINESFYAEIKVARTRVEAGEQMAALGALPIGGAE